MKQELAERQEQQVAHTNAPITPMDMLNMAVQQGADLEKLEKLMDLQHKWEANEARKAFVAALNAFKADPPTLTKNKHVEYGNTKYDHASLDHVSAAIGQALSAHSLSHRWDTEQMDGGLIRVTCILTHDAGHTERTTLQASPDQSGQKNNIQAIGSTVTYLQRYTLLAATGMAVGGQDDDGKSADAKPTKTITDAQASKIADMLDATKTAEGTLIKWVFAGKPPEGATVKDIPEAMFARCMTRLNATLKQQQAAS